eukprot:m.69614 g.69614  ORF g.69614 m.69614 type:complete len:187 (-) comp13745_c0_seq2:100-660(-)
MMIFMIIVIIIVMIFTIVVMIIAIIVMIIIIIVYSYVGQRPNLYCERPRNLNVRGGIFWSTEISEAKTKFLDEKLQFQRQAASALQQLEREAAAEALQCIDEHTAQVKNTNKQLRRQLIKVFQQSKQLLEREELLRKQNIELKRLVELNVNVRQPGTKRDQTLTNLSRNMSGNVTDQSRVQLPRLF